MKCLCFKPEANKITPAILSPIQNFSEPPSILIDMKQVKKLHENLVKCIQELNLEIESDLTLLSKETLNHVFGSKCFESLENIQEAGGYRQEMQNSKLETGTVSGRLSNLKLFKRSVTQPDIDLNPTSPNLRTLNQKNGDSQTTIFEDSELDLTQLRKTVGHDISRKPSANPSTFSKRFTTYAEKLKRNYNLSDESVNQGTKIHKDTEPNGTSKDPQDQPSSNLGLRETLKRKYSIFSKSRFSSSSNLDHNSLTGNRLTQLNSFASKLNLTRKKYESVKSLPTSFCKVMISHQKKLPGVRHHLDVEKFEAICHQDSIDYQNFANLNSSSGKNSTFEPKNFEFWG